MFSRPRKSDFFIKRFTTPKKFSHTHCENHDSLAKVSRSRQVDESVINSVHPPPYNIHIISLHVVPQNTLCQGESI